MFSTKYLCKPMNMKLGCIKLAVRAVFLLDRTQTVKCNQSISSSVCVTSGAPEGVRVIGPLIFVLYVNDLSYICTPCSVKLYADDIKLYFTVKTPAAKAVLQTCLDRVHK